MRAKKTELDCGTANKFGVLVSNRQSNLQTSQREASWDTIYSLQTIAKKILVIKAVQLLSPIGTM